MVSVAVVDPAITRTGTEPQLNKKLQLVCEDFSDNASWRKTTHTRQQGWADTDINRTFGATGEDKRIPLLIRYWQSPPTRGGVERLLIIS